MSLFLPLLAGAIVGGLVGCACGGQQGGLVRVHVVAPLEYVDQVRAMNADGQKALLDDVRRRVEAMGFSGTRVVMQDPTDNQIFRLLTHPTTWNSETGQDPFVRITLVEPVEDLPVPDAPAPDDGTLDPGLKISEVWTIRQALASEVCPRHLRGLASTLVPWFPVSASLLYAKANSLDPHWLGQDGGVDHVGFGAVEHRLARLGMLARQRDLPPDLLNLEVKRAACLLAEDPQTPFPEVPPVVVAMGRALVRSTVEGARYVDPDLVRRWCPPDGREGFVSPSALQLVHAYGKPEISGVVSRQEVARRRAELAANVRAELGAGQDRTARQDLMRAKAAMEKAERTLERRRWIEWYKRTAA